MSSALKLSKPLKTVLPLTPNCQFSAFSWRTNCKMMYNHLETRSLASPLIIFKALLWLWSGINACFLGSHIPSRHLMWDETKKHMNKCLIWKCFFFLLISSLQARCVRNKERPKSANKAEKHADLSTLELHTGF